MGAAATLDPGSRVPLANGLAELVLAIRPGTPFGLVLEQPTHDLSLRYDGLTLEFHYEPRGNRVIPHYRTTHQELRTVRLFVDVGLIEIHVDGGRACCTKRIDSSMPVTALRLEPGYYAEAADIWSLRPPGP